MDQIQWRQYLVDLKPIGYGFLGKVYSGNDLMDQKKVALKELVELEVGLHETFVMIMYTQSAFFPALYDLFLLDGKLYIVMEFIEGETLGINNFGDCGQKWGETQSVQITINILEGLKFLHHIGLVHSDLKPGNVMIKDKMPETIKIIDFNLSHEITNTDDILSDLERAALMCLFLINGFIPEPIHDFEIHSRLKSVLMRALDEMNENRYQSAEEFINALKPFV